MQSNFSTLCRGHIIPKELDKETAAKFMEAAEQFERIINDSGFVRLRRLSTDEIVGTDGKAGLIERYFSLMPEGDATLQDIDLSAREMRIGDNRLCLHTLSDAEDLPGTVATDTRYEKLSTDRSDCRLSFASPVRCWARTTRTATPRSMMPWCVWRRISACVTRLWTARATSAPWTATPRLLTVTPRPA
jgi:hypothetical protein